MLTPSTQSPQNTVCRIRAEYLEMPGLKLTPAQAQRLWDLDRESCETLLTGLVTTGFLARTLDGALTMANVTRPALHTLHSPRSPRRSDAEPRRR